jgi:hypothetical protein
MIDTDASMPPVLYQTKFPQGFKRVMREIAILWLKEIELKKSLSQTKEEMFGMCYTQAWIGMFFSINVQDEIKGFKRERKVVDNTDRQGNTDSGDRPD